MVIPMLGGGHQSMVSSTQPSACLRACLKMGYCTPESEIALVSDFSSPLRLQSWDVLHFQTQMILNDPRDLLVVSTLDS